MTLSAALGCPQNEGMALQGPFASPQGNSLAWRPGDSSHKILSLRLEPAPPISCFLEEMTKGSNLPGRAGLRQAGGTVSAKIPKLGSILMFWEDPVEEAAPELG